VGREALVRQGKITRSAAVTPRLGDGENSAEELRLRSGNDVVGGFVYHYDKVLPTCSYSVEVLRALMTHQRMNVAIISRFMMEDQGASEGWRTTFSRLKYMNPPRDP